MDTGSAIMNLHGAAAIDSVDVPSGGSGCVSVAVRVIMPAVHWRCLEGAMWSTRPSVTDAVGA
jgi:hypothetical protein